MIRKKVATFLSHVQQRIDSVLLRYISAKHLAIAKSLTGLASVCLLLIFLLFTLTKTRVHNNEVAYLRASLSQVLPNGVSLSEFDNDVLNSKQVLGETIVYPACQGGKLRYALIELETDKGYSGLIRLLANVDWQQHTVVAVRPLYHQETPGLGDQIATDKSDWLTQFALPLQTAKNLAVDKDGGSIDSITGATITSRAVANVLNQQIFSNHWTAQEIKQLKSICNTNPKK